MTAWTLLIISVLAVLGFLLGRTRAAALRTAGEGMLHSLPSYHGLFVGTSAALGASFAAIAARTAMGPESAFIPLAAAVAGTGFAGATLLALNTRFRARNAFERIVMAILIACSVVAILVTVGIVFSVAFETFYFFREVSPISFLFGTLWAPTATPPSFGFIPLLVGTLLITLIAIVVAAPLGLLSAIYMAEYADRRTRAVVKPMLEILAGVPTVVLGFFAALTVAPLIRRAGESLGLSVASESALAAGLVMGMMIVPLISSLADDIINSVPQSLRDGSYAMGATKSETIRRVVFPAALPGVVSALILAVSRAVGETMIVVMAAGLAANLTFNPLHAVTTITVQIAALLVGDQEFDSAKTLSAFALGFVLFFITLVLNFVALRVVQRYREQYD
jgi:phosphate transport system permease protein